MPEIEALNGLNPLAYIGVNPRTPPQSVAFTRSPTINDNKGFQLLSLWLNTATQNIFALTSLAGGVATWTNLDTGGSFANVYQTDSGNAVPAASIIIFNALSQAGASVTFSGATNIVSLNTTDANNNTFIGSGAGNATATGTDNTGLGKNAGSSYATTEANNVIIGSTQTGVAGEIGTVRIGSWTGTSNTNNTFMGHKAGNNTYTLVSAINNTLIGSYSGTAITTAAHNTCVGQAAGAVLTTGQDNTFVGSNSGAASFVSGTATGGQNTAIGNDTLWACPAGNRNLTLGNQSGSSLTTNDSDNILLHNQGTVGDNHTIRIGSGTGTGNYQSNKTFVSGIYNITPGVTNPYTVVADSNGQLGTKVTSAFSAYLSTNVLNFTGNGASPTVVFDTEVFDINNDYDNTTYTFTAPVTGVYQFNVTVSLSNLTNVMIEGLGTFRVVGTSASAGTWAIARNNAYATSGGISGIWRYNGGLCTTLNTGDQVFCGVQISGGAGDTATLDTGGAPLGGTWFSGCRIA